MSEHEQQQQFGQSVRGGYDRWAGVYDHDGNPLVALEGPAVRAAVGEVRGLDVLDLGCGTGRHALWLAAEAAGARRVTAWTFPKACCGRPARSRGLSACASSRMTCTTGGCRSRMARLTSW